MELSDEHEQLLLNVLGPLPRIPKPIVLDLRALCTICPLHCLQPMHMLQVPQST
jgi:hypothetical protein